MTPSANFHVLIPAAGVGKRMGSSIPKQYLLLGDKCVLQHTLNKFIDLDDISSILIGVSADDAWFDEMIQGDDTKLQRFIGGAERADTVRLGLDHLPDDDWVLVHDAARPFVSSEDVERLIAQCRERGKGTILAKPARDTIKRLTGEVTTIDRHQIFMALTPQCFQVSALKQALLFCQQNHWLPTDEANAIELSGGEVELLTSSPLNIKLTEPDDLVIAQAIAKHQDLL